MAALPHPQEPEQQVDDKASLLDVLAIAQAWGTALAAQLDSPSRTRTCRALQQFVLQAAPQATVTLLAYSGLSEATWQQRLAGAEQGLLTRGPGQRRGTKVLLRIPTPHPTALQSVLSMSAAASHCYSALQVQQYDYPTAAGRDAAPNPPQPWPAVEAPHIHTLILSHMCGPLPSSALLPHLRELQVHFWVVERGTANATRSVHQRCASIAPFVPQLSSLSVTSSLSNQQQGRRQDVIPWSAVFGTQVSNSLTHFQTTEEPYGCA